MKNANEIADLMLKTRNNLIQKGVAFLLEKFSEEFYILLAEELEKTPTKAYADYVGLSINEFSCNENGFTIENSSNITFLTCAEFESDTLNDALIPLNQMNEKDMKLFKGTAPYLLDLFKEFESNGGFIIRFDTRLRKIVGFATTVTETL